MSTKALPELRGPLFFRTGDRVKVETLRSLVDVAERQGKSGIFTGLVVETPALIDDRYPLAAMRVRAEHGSHLSILVIFNVLDPLTHSRPKCPDHVLAKGCAPDRVTIL